MRETRKICGQVHESSACPTCFNSYMIVEGDPPVVSPVDYMVGEIASLRAQLEQTQVQLAGCGVAALGWNDNPAKPGDYGWSATYQDVLDLRARLEGANKRIGDLEIKLFREELKVAETERKRDEAKSEVTGLDQRLANRSDDLEDAQIVIAALKSQRAEITRQTTELAREIHQAHFTSSEWSVLPDASGALSQISDMMMAWVDQDRAHRRATAQRDALQAVVEAAEKAAPWVGIMLDPDVDPTIPPTYIAKEVRADISAFLSALADLRAKEVSQCQNGCGQSSS